MSLTQDGQAGSQDLRPEALLGIEECSVAWRAVNSPLSFPQRRARVRKAGAVARTMRAGLSRFLENERMQNDGEAVRTFGPMSMRRRRPPRHKGSRSP
jgi:hypothetical protein